MFNSIFIKKSIKKQTIVQALVSAFLFAVLITSSLTAHAATGLNKQVNFQGKVVNSDGTNVADGSYSFTFSLYSVSSAGTAIWTETKSLTVTDGIFRTDLGDTTSLPGSVDFNTDNIYLGINFNSDGEMSPRVRLDAVPQAFNADAVDGIDGASLLRSDTSDSFTSGTLTFNDSTVLALGTGNDLQLTHNGTDSSITSATGNLTINNTNATGVTIAKLGTGTSATSFQVQNSSGTALFTINGAGTLTASAFTTNGGLLYTNASGVVSQTGAGTSTTVLHGGTTPTYGAIVLSTDTSGTLPVANGGTGQTTYTDGQILIGNSSGNTLTKATITGTANQVVVTNGTGTITLSTPQDIATTSSPTFTGETLQNNVNGDSTQLLIDNANALGGSGLRINRTSNVRASQIQLSTGGATDWYVGQLRRGGSASNTFSIGRGSDINTTVPLMNIATSGLVGWGVVTPTYNMSFEGTVAKTIGIERNTTSNTAGVSWNLSAGAATSGAADKDGGTAALTGGVSTGTGVSRVTFSVSPGVAASTSDNTIAEIARFTGQGMNFLHGTTTVPTGATYNQVLGGGSTTPVLGAATADLVSLAAVDKAAGDRRLYIQSELGSAISLGNDRLNFAASTGLISIAGTDLLSMT
ncbi:MAG: hypothetical protein K8Q97_04925, partial [Candidatus Andersenbacteria bacterium]|nr:hypothetical protein [Candidatus Andersenbacteria bacterium]